MARLPGGRRWRGHRHRAGRERDPRRVRRPARAALTGDGDGQLFGLKLRLLARDAQPATRPRRSDATTPIAIRTIAISTSSPKRNTRPPVALKNPTRPPNRPPKDGDALPVA